MEARASARRAAAQAAEGRLTVPRRPPWRKDMSPDELDVRERESFLMWRRDLASCVPWAAAAHATLCPAARGCALRPPDAPPRPAAGWRRATTLA